MRACRELRLARADVKHLQAACLALRTYPRAMLVAGTTIRAWDREVVEEHAARAGVSLRWVEARIWASDTLRRARR